MSTSDNCPGLSPNTVRKHHNLLHKALGQAVKWQLISRNPADQVEPPSIEKPEIKVLPDASSIRKLYDQTRGSILYLPIIFATSCGMRRGEICGLRWGDVDWELRRVYIRQSLERREGEGLCLKSTKNKQGRPVSLPNSVMDLLRREYFTRYENDGMEHAGDPICVWGDGRPIDPNYITHGFKKLTKKLGLNITFHGLRHSHDTLLLRYNVNPKLVADRSGRDEKLTLTTHQHVLPDMQDSVADLLDKILFDQSEDQ